MRRVRPFRIALYKELPRSIAVLLIIVSSVALSTGRSVARVTVERTAIPPASADAFPQQAPYSGSLSAGLIPVDEFYSGDEPDPSYPGDEPNPSYSGDGPYIGHEEGEPAPYPTPPPMFPCGPNAIENQAWGGAPSGFLGLLGSIVASRCPSYLRQPRRRPFVSCDTFSSNQGFLRLAAYDAPALTARTYGARTRGYDGAPIGPIRNVCVQMVNRRLQLSTPDGVFQLTRIDDFTRMVPRQSYGHEAYSPVTLSQYTVRTISLPKGSLLNGRAPKFKVIGFNQIIDGNNQVIGYDAYYYAAPNLPDRAGPAELKSETWLGSAYVSQYWGR